MPFVSSKKFWYITILILLTPIGVHWNLLINGTYTKGTVIGFRVPDYDNLLLQQPVEGIDLYSIIKVQTEKKDTLLSSQKNIIYPLQQNVPIVYKNNSYLILSFSGFYLNLYGAFSGILLVFWIAFYLAVNKVVKKHP